MIFGIALIIFGIVFSDPEVIIMLVIGLIFFLVIGSQLYYPMEKVYDPPEENRIIYK